MKVMLFDIFTGKFIHMANKIAQVCINHLLHYSLIALSVIQKVVLLSSEYINIPQLRINYLRQESFKEYFGRVEAEMSLFVIGKHRGLGR
jgi:hypothetical protein